MERAVRDLFARYETFTARALAGEATAGEAAGLYAGAFIAAGPWGVVTGTNDAALARSIEDGFRHYRDIGTREMRITGIRVQPIDDLHAVAHVGWTARYARDDLPETVVDFEVHYLVQLRDGAARVFGWVSGDENALLRERGII